MVKGRAKPQGRLTVGLPEDFDCEWADWMAGGGAALEQEIKTDMRAKRHVLDINDGTHAAWHDDSLGVLLVLDDHEVMGLLEMWGEAAEGNIIALSKCLEWLHGLFGFIDQCAGMHPDD
jgi:hypothetical protein|tara:strand:+ start:9159 stop:9515 length:357 start_codon:yes stop_codon:yes gene_type:complete